MHGQQVAESEVQAVAKGKDGKGAGLHRSKKRHWKNTC